MPKKSPQPKLQFSSITESRGPYKAGLQAEALPPSFPLQLQASRIKISAPEIWRASLSAGTANFQHNLIQQFKVGV